jgi:hypothetical protein
VIEPGDSLGYGCNGWAIRHGWPLKHEYRDAEGSRGGNLAVRGNSTAVLRDNRIDGEGFEQLPIAGLGERAACEDVVCMWHIERRVHRIDAADEVVMLWGAAEWNQLLPADREEDASRLAPQRTNGALRVRNSDPEITLQCGPGRSAQSQDRRGGLRSCRGCVGGNDLRIWMRSIDQKVDALSAQIFSESLGAAETTDPHRNGLSGRRCSSAGKRYGRSELARRQRYSKLASLRGSPKNQDIRAHGWQS